MGKIKHERYVKLRYWLLNSPAWQSLLAVDRAIYLEIVKRYNGSNSGRISFAVREAADAVHVGKMTAKRSLDRLQERGFIRCVKRGAFSLKTVRDASIWCLTEYDCDT